MGEGENGSGAAYKMTELGELPAEWETAAVGDLFDIQQGKSLSPRSRAGKSPRCFLRTANVYWARVDLASVDAMDFTDEEARKLALRAGDLLVCEGGEIGRTAMWRGELENCYYQNHLHRLRAKVEGVEPKFYMYWMQAAITVLGLYRGEGNKTTIPNLSQSRLRSFVIPRPPVDEQRAIAAVLSTIQCAIEAHDKVIAAAREVKKSLMRHLFTYGPVPVAEAARVVLKGTEIGMVPGEWQMVRLGEVSEISTGTTPSTARPDYYLGNIPFVRTAEVANNIVERTTMFLSDKAVSDYGLKLYGPGTIFLAMYGQGKTRGQVAFLNTAATTTQNTAAIVCHANLVDCSISLLT